MGGAFPADRAGRRFPLRFVFFCSDRGGVSPVDVNAILPGVICIGARAGPVCCLRGLRDAGIIVPNAATVVGMGNLRAPRPLWLRLPAVRLPCCRRGGCSPRFTGHSVDDSVFFAWYRQVAPGHYRWQHDGAGVSAHIPRSAAPEWKLWRRRIGSCFRGSVC